MEAGREVRLCIALQRSGVLCERIKQAARLPLKGSADNANAPFYLWYVPSASRWGVRRGRWRGDALGWGCLAGSEHVSEARV